ncbi:TetR/AcrR family transcriptional regulator [Roseibium sediminicola]|uniref:TetR/AcrR family transcriptional regulator n=1 Tax=Roseibium sediminicola TaxID=2933272 RepID=A0ABT0GRW0_9HYPH|nr:TetR/AcrR family transcriptional regulator [Roseibium sp. CAU 1639]
MSSVDRVARTRAEILDSAWDLISVRGAEVSLAEIAKAAGISRQSVYDHFGSRGGLILGLVRRADERLDIKARFDEAFETVNPAKRLEASIEVWIRFVEEIYPVASDLIRLRSTDADASAAWEDRMSELRDWLLILTGSLERDGALQADWSAKEAADYLWASFSVQSWGLLTRDCSWSEERALEVLKRTIRQALLRPAVA